MKAPKVAVETDLASLQDRQIRIALVAVHELRKARELAEASGLWLLHLVIDEAIAEAENTVKKLQTKPH